MSKYIKIVGLFVFVFILNGCSPKSPIISSVPFDVTQKGYVHESIINIEETRGCSFDLDYIVNKELYNLESEDIEGLEEVGEYNGKMYRYWIDTSIGKAVGRGAYNLKLKKDHMVIPGIKILLKLTITPLQKLAEPIIYYPRMAEPYASEIIPIGEPIEYTFDMAYIKKYLGQVGRPDRFHDQYPKSMASFKLEKGRYKVRLENLRAVPKEEIGHILTRFTIGRKYSGK